MFITLIPGAQREGDARRRVVLSQDEPFRRPGEKKFSEEFLSDNFFAAFTIKPDINLPDGNELHNSYLMTIKGLYDHNTALTTAVWLITLASEVNFINLHFSPEKFWTIFKT
jgi:hypothetical protein